MRGLLSGVVVVGLSSSLLLGCPVDPPPVTPPAPPRAFLTIPLTTVVNTSIKGAVTTMGCKKVGQVQILESGNYLIDAQYKGEPTNFEIAPALLNRLYPARGFSTPLSLSAKVICEDTTPLTDGGFLVREGLSQPASLTFLPVESVRATPGFLALPDSFVAEGGIAGQPTTFIGCTATNTGRALVRVDSTGMIRAINEALPQGFICDYTSVVTDLNTTTGTRWLWIPQTGAFAFDGNLNITSVFNGEVSRLSVAPDGDAIVALEDPSAATKTQLLRIRARTTTGQDSRVWSTLTGPLDTGYPGELNSDPVVVSGTPGRVYSSSWQYRIQATSGLIAVLAYDYNTGLLVNDPPPAILNFTFPNPLNRPIKPNGAFKEDGTLFYAPLLTIDNQGQVSTTVLACATNIGGCQNAARRWTSPTFPGELTTIVPFSRGNLLAIVGPFATWFLGSTDGLVKNLTAPQADPQPLRPSGSLITQGVVPGKGTDFYLLNGPIPPNEQTPSFPTEIIATDHPSAGALWQLSIMGGTQPADSLFVAVDDNGQAWMRMATDQVRPLGLMQYRSLRGATPP